MKKKISLRNGILILIPGQSVFQLSNGAMQYFVCYLPQDYLDQVSFGQKLTLFRQGSQEEAARGTVSFIDLQAVYPPEQTSALTAQPRWMRVTCPLWGRTPSS